MQVSDERVPVAVVGVGRMGRHHAKVYNNLPNAQLVAVADSNEERAESVAAQYGCAAVSDPAELIEKFPHIKAVTIAVPTVFHRSAAEPLLKRGIACLVEKPLAASSEEGRAIVKLAEAHGAVLQVGHTERFNPVVRAVTALNIVPRFVEVHRVSPMTFRSLDIGVVMDMMIHDLDIVLSLANSKLDRVDAAGVAVLGEHEDVANARLAFANGCVANLTASRLALKTERRLRLFNENAYINLDYQKRTGLIIRKSDNDLALNEIREQIRQGIDLTDLDYSNLLYIDELKMDGPEGHSDPLTGELAAFLDCVTKGGKPVVDGQAGVAAVEAAERVVASITSHKWEGLTVWNA
ncbi:MAG: Gfo/Idh/MocA family oxidoreductase [Phycisphaeraceae bacterium]